MKAFFLFIVVIGISLKAAQSRVSENLRLDPLVAESADEEERIYNKPCCHPDVMEGKMSALFRLQPNSYGEFHVDYRNRRLAVENWNQSQKIKTIVLCDLRNTCLVYNIQENQRKCSKIKVSNASIDDFWIRCIPSNTTSFGRVRIGSDDKRSSLQLQVWMFMRREMKLERVVTEIDCIPVIDFLSTDTAYMGQIYYYDIAKRIKDTSVFKPPSYCADATEINDDSQFQQLMFTSLFSPLE